MAIVDDEHGFSLIELFTVLIIISILAAIVIPTYYGISNTAKKSRLISSCRSGSTVLSSWLMDYTSTDSSAISIDTNFDNVVNGSDMTNGAISTKGLAQTFVDGKNNNVHETSPWDVTLNLWTTDSMIPNSVITLIESSANIRVVGKDYSGNIIYDNTLNK